MHARNWFADAEQEVTWALHFNPLDKPMTRNGVVLMWNSGSRPQFLEATNVSEDNAVVFVTFEVNDLLDGFNAEQVRVTSQAAADIMEQLIEDKINNMEFELQIRQ